jgi:hypothetical protein
MTGRKASNRPEGKSAQVRILDFRIVSHGGGAVEQRFRKRGMARWLNPLESHKRE